MLNILSPREYNKAKRCLLTAYNLLAPTGASQNRMAASVIKMEKDGMLSNRILCTIAVAIVDGVSLGNW